MNRNYFSLLTMVAILASSAVCYAVVKVKEAERSSVTKPVSSKAENSIEKEDRILLGSRQIDANTAAKLEKREKEDPAAYRKEPHEPIRAKFYRGVNVPVKMPNEKSNPVGIDKAIKLKASTSKAGPIAPNDNSPLAVAIKEESKINEQIKNTLEGVKSASDDSQKQKLTGELKDLVGRKVDLSLKKKRLEYEQTLSRLTKFQEQIKANQAELKNQESADARNSKIDAMMKDMIGSSQK